MSIAPLTQQDQYLLELINRARANPTAEATRQGVALNQGLTPGQISATARQPLVPLATLTRFATARANFYHWPDTNEETPSEAQIKDWMADYGFAPTEAFQAGEALSTWRYYSYRNGIVSGAPATSDDWMKRIFTTPATRATTLADAWSVWGTGVFGDVIGAPGVSVSTDYRRQAFATDGPAVYLTGVAYRDTVINDDFYSIGEAVGVVTITARNLTTDEEYTTDSNAAGGYALMLPAGTYAVTASAPTFGQMSAANVTVSDKNLKLDFRRDGEGSNGPKAVATVGNVTSAGGGTYTFTVAYSDVRHIDTSTLGSGDVLIQPPTGLPILARLVSVAETPRPPKPVTFTYVARYEFTPPGGSWNVPENGTYTLLVPEGQVKNDGGAPVAPGQLATFDVSLNAVASGTFRAGGDFNADGRDDLIWRDAVTGSVYLWFTTATGLGQLQLLQGGVSTHWIVGGADDFDADGDDDLFWYNTATGMTAYWEMDGDTRVAHRTLFAVKDLDWRPVDASDFNADGKADIVWTNATRGLNLIWTSRPSAAGFDIATLPPLRNLDWRLRAVAKTPGEGKHDLIWNHVPTNTRLRWRMNGTTVVAGTVIGSTGANPPVIGGLRFDDNDTEDFLEATDDRLSILVHDPSRPVPYYRVTLASPFLIRP